MEFNDKIKGIVGFLERYKNFVPPSLALSRAVRAAVEETVHIAVSEKQIRVLHGVVYVQLGGAQKSEILLHKETILNAARAKIGASLRDIK